MLSIKKILLFFLTISNISCLSDNKKIELVKDKNFPQWLKVNEIQTDQTSGICFIGKDDKDTDIFLLADDIGDLYYLKIKDEKISSLEKISLSPGVTEYLRKFPKKDFEDICYGKNENKVYLSIEGNGKDYKDFVGIYQINFKDNNILSGVVTEINKINIQPEEEFLRYTYPNIGYEGMAVDENYLYLGLETCSRNPIISDSTYIFIIDKKDLNIIKEINTKEIEVVSICGLYIKDNNLMGVDRNRKNFFTIHFDKQFNITSYQITGIKTNIPGYTDFDYISSLESITMDDNNNVYFVEDPWKTHYVPNQEILSSLNSETRENFIRVVPIIYKFNLQASG